MYVCVNLKFIVCISNMNFYVAILLALHGGILGLMSCTEHFPTVGL